MSNQIINNLLDRIGRVCSETRNRSSSLASTRMLLVGAVLGVAVGLVAVGFRSLIQLSTSLFFPHDPEKLGIIGRWWRYLSVLVPAAGGLAVGLIMHFLIRDNKKISGVPEVIWAVAFKGGKLGPAMGFKGLLAAATIGSGGSAGPEGPIVEIGSSFASYLGQRLKLSLGDLRLFAGCGAAAGIAGVFGAPLGGVFFALEIVLGEFSVSAFAPVVLASVAAAIVSRTFLGDQPAFQVTVGSIGSLWDILPYMLLGIFSGLVSVLFVSAIASSQRFFKNLSLPGWIKPGLGGLLVGLLGILAPQVQGEGYHVVTAVLSGNLIWWVALILVLAKILGTAFTLGSGAPGGSFAPALFIGAMLGGAFNQLAILLLPQFFRVNPAYSLAGAAGVVAGALGAPLTAGLLIFEVSGTYRVVMPCLIVVAAATAIAHRLSQGSIYTRALHQDGVPLDRLLFQPQLSAITCRRAMRREVTAVLPQAPLSDIVKIFGQLDQELLPVIDESNHYLGAINWSQLTPFLKEQDSQRFIIAHDIMMLTPTVSPEDSLSLALMHLLNEDLQEIPVVEEGRLVGLLSGRAILTFK